jgi:hypothetical protein
LGAGGAKGSSYVEGEGGDAVLSIGGVVDDAADGGEGVVGLDVGEGGAVETGDCPAEGEEGRGIGGWGGGVAVWIEDARARRLEVEEEVGVVGGEQ